MSHLVKTEQILKLDSSHSFFFGEELFAKSGCFEVQLLISFTLFSKKSQILSEFFVAKLKGEQWFRAERFDMIVNTVTFLISFRLRWLHTFMKIDVPNIAK